MIDEEKLLDKIDAKQFELDYGIIFDNGIEEYEKIKCKIEALEWVKRLIAKESNTDFQIDGSIKLGKEWE